MGAGRVGPVVFVLVRSCGRVVLLVSWLTSYAGQDPGRGREGAAVSSPSGLARDGVGFVSTPANVRATELQTSGGEKGEAGRRARVRRGAGSGSGTWDVLGAGGKPKTDPQSSSRQATGNRAKQTPSEYYFRNRPPTFRWLLALCAGCERERQKDIDMRKRESGGRRSKSYKGRSVGGRSVLVLTLDWAISWRPPLEDVETPGTQHPSTVQVATGGSCWVLTGDVISLVVARYRRNSLAKGGREGGGRDVRGDRPCKSALAEKNRCLSLLSHQSALFAGLPGPDPSIHCIHGSIHFNKSWARRERRRHTGLDGGVKGVSRTCVALTTMYLGAANKSKNKSTKGEEA